MSDNRREFIKKSVVLGGFAASGLIGSQRANAEWFSEPATTNMLEETLKRLIKDKTITETDKIDIQMPKIAENGLNVPVTITSSLKNVVSIAILVDEKPAHLIAKFELSPALEASVSTRLKIPTKSDILVIVETTEKYYSAREKVNVVIGGCED
jgi:sulfur-oxidizing protein SoxY